MVGQRLFNEITKDSGIDKTLRKGRNDSLVYKRNNCMVARYYYYVHFKKKCYEDILRQMVGEFFLSPATIVHIIQNDTEQILELRLKKPKLYFFQNRWPHLKW